MPRLPSLTVVIPEFTDGMTDEWLTQSDGLLARLAGRGTLQRRWQPTDAEAARLAPWQRGLLNALHLDERSHPSGPLTALGGAASNTLAWMHAEPVHFAAGMNEVALVPLSREHRLSIDERTALAHALQQHLASIQLSLFTTPSGSWLLGAEQDWKSHTVTPQFARTHEWNVVLPQGSGAGRLRRLMTEMQMLLHEHPVNESRAARGLLTANAVWLWGGGEARRTSNGVTHRCVGSNDYLAGICHIEEWNSPRSFAEFARVMSEADSHVVVVLDAAALDAKGLHTVIAALEQGRCARMDLVLDEWEVRIDRWSLKKFWRPARALSEWART